MVIPDKEVLLNENRNRLYYHDTEDHDLLLVNTVEENQEGLSHRALSGDRDARRALAIFGYLLQKTL